MVEILTARNKYNITSKQIIIDYEKREYQVFFGCEGKNEKRNSTKKAINEKIDQLKVAGFKELKRS